MVMVFFPNFGYFLKIAETISYSPGKRIAPFPSKAKGRRAAAPFCHILSLLYSFSKSATVSTWAVRGNMSTAAARMAR